MELNELVLGMKKKSFDGATGVIICDNDRNWDDELYNEIKKNIQYLVDKQG